MFIYISKNKHVNSHKHHCIYTHIYAHLHIYIWSIVSMKCVARVQNHNFEISKRVWSIGKSVYLIYVLVCKCLGRCKYDSTIPVKHSGHHNMQWRYRLANRRILLYWYRCHRQSRCWLVFLFVLLLFVWLL